MALTHTLLLPDATVATNVDAYNRHAFSATLDFDNGDVFELLTKSTDSDKSEVWQATAPDAITGLWMAYDGDKVITTNSMFRGLEVDSRAFYNAKGKVFSAFKPKVNDIITISAAGIEGTYTPGTTLYANAEKSKTKLQFGATQTSAALSFKILAQTYISVGAGGMDSQRVVAYELECVNE